MVIKNGVWVNKNLGLYSEVARTIGSDAWISEVIVDNNDSTMVRLQLWGNTWITYNIPNPQYYAIPAGGRDILIETCSGASM